MQRVCWQRAKVGTKVREIFDMGATDGEHRPNWVTLWLLYSVFRARDDRNNRKGRTTPSRRGVDGKVHGGRVEPSTPLFFAPMLTCNPAGYPPTTQIGPRTLKYDPIRDIR